MDCLTQLTSTHKGQVLWEEIQEYSLFPSVLLALTAASLVKLVILDSTKALSSNCWTMMAMMQSSSNSSTTTSAPSLFVCTVHLLPAVGRNAAGFNILEDYQLVTGNANLAGGRIDPEPRILLAA